MTPFEQKLSNELSAIRRILAKLTEEKPEAGSRIEAAKIIGSDWKLREVIKSNKAIQLGRGKYNLTELRKYAA